MGILNNDGIQLEIVEALEEYNLLKQINTTINKNGGNHKLSYEL